VKHGLTRCPHTYEFSTFVKWVRRNVYEPSWCCACLGALPEPPSFDGLDESAME
jgi:putative transposase